ncbi:hypothetical protein AB205_0142220 [Aquarana catesbeiana]|uniref:Uncharacterized protein n=1 Tax=Aquarana catesbeiana TaxID=8400 RepID=A0A2G9SFG5_AQUCT|nr:hypothetical protein AB205_0142220 [Aquarana catesbeiana]
MYMVDCSPADELLDPAVTQPVIVHDLSYALKLTMALCKLYFLHIAAFLFINAIEKLLSSPPGMPKMVLAEQAADIEYKTSLPHNLVVVDCPTASTCLEQDCGLCPGLDGIGTLEDHRGSKAAGTSLAVVWLQRTAIKKNTAMYALNTCNDSILFINLFHNE